LFAELTKINHSNPFSIYNYFCGICFDKTACSSHGPPFRPHKTHACRFLCGEKDISVLYLISLARFAPLRGAPTAAELGDAAAFVALDFGGCAKNLPGIALLRD
jgi:hypothetical protein